MLDICFFPWYSQNMKAIHVNAAARTVTLVEIEKVYPEANALLGCQLITTAGYDGRGNVAFTDDEGLLCNPEHFALVPTFHPHPLAGGMVIVGDDGEGDSEDVKLTVEQVRAEVKFLDAYDLAIWAAMTGN
jgi:hypothetical protein